MTQEPKQIDPEILQCFIDYIKGHLKHSYKEARHLAMLLRLGNLEVEDLFIKPPPSIPYDTKYPIRTEESLKQNLDEIIKPKIKSIPNQNELREYEWIFARKEYLPEGYRKSFLKVYQSPENNIVKDLDGAPLNASRIRELNAWKNSILRNIEEIKGEDKNA